MHALITRRRVAGVSLLEVLIASSVLSIGVLGMADLQIRSLQASQSDLATGTAAILADALAARLRGNRVAAAQGLYSSPITSTVDCTTTSCDAATIAAYDMAHWQQQLATDLPGGSGFVSCGSAPCTAAAVQTITIHWLDVTQTSNDARCGSGKPGLHCFSLSIEP